MDSININNYIDGLMNHNNMFTAIMGKIFFTVPVFLKALETNNIAYSLLFILLNAVMAGLLFFLGSKLYLRGVYLVSSVGKAEKKEDVVSDAAYAKKYSQSIFSEGM